MLGCCGGIEEGSWRGELAMLVERYAGKRRDFIYGQTREQPASVAG